MTAPHTTATTDPQSIIVTLQHRLDAGLAREAILAEELAARDATLAQRNSEYGERIEHQAATVDVLKAMSASPGDAQPVFDLIARQAANQCNVPTAAVATYDGAMMHLASQSGLGAAYVAQFPRPVGLDFSMGRAVLNRRVDQVEDITADPGHSFAPVLGPWSVIAVPILRDGQPLGAITIGRPAMGPFSASQVALLQTFADQAVIAITSAETYRALQTRTSDLQETLEYQTAISDVLKVISRSAFDLQPVLATLLKTAARLCDADTAGMASREGDKYPVVATFFNTPAFDTFIRGQSFTASRASVTGRTVLEGRIVHISDLAADPEYAVTEAVTLGGVRTLLGVPLLREGEVAGVIIVGRFRVQPFTDRQIELVSTFADQAVIAIENTRLLTEQREALEQQTATAEVLQVINASPGNLVPVFDAIIDKARHLTEAQFGGLFTYDGEFFDLFYTSAGGEPELVQAEEGSALAELVAGAPLVHIPDVADTDAYRAGVPSRVRLVEVFRARTTLWIALRKDNVLFGALAVHRPEVRPFNNKQIALLQNFAAQAVIAMENARLITEQREALEQQTATAEVLQVINASPGNLAPVFDAMLEKAMRLCGGTIGGIFTFYGDHSVTSAVRGVTAAFQAYNDKYPMDKIQPGTVPARIIETRGPVQNPDVTVGETYRAGHPYARALVELGGIRAVLAVPLLKDGVAIGMVAIYRQEAGAFSAKQIALLENFAAQAVVAMENARLMTEQREALEQQTATAEVLQVINASPGNLTPVFDAVLEKAHMHCSAAVGSLMTYDGEHLRVVATRGFPEGYAALVRQPFLPSAPVRTLIASERLLHAADLRAIQPKPEGLTGMLIDRANARTGLAIPLRKDGAFLGLICVYRAEVRPFSDKEIALLENFAAQAVIAMENARLLTEQHEALDQQTATAEVLQVINASPGDLGPVFDTMIEKAMRLCGAAFGSFYTYDGEQFLFAAQRGLPEAFAEFRTQTPLKPVPGSQLARAIENRQTLQVLDLKTEELYLEGNPFVHAMVDLGGVRTILVVPLCKDEAVLGFLSVYRQEVRAFSAKQIALLESFAAQAVIAMENARLLTEQQEALEQQTATAEVLQVINASPGNLTPVFEAILEKAHSLCDVAVGSLSIYLNGLVHTAATRGFTEEYEALLRRPYPAIGSHQALMRGGPSRQTPDFRTVPVSPEMASSLDHLGRMNLRTGLWVPLRKDGTALGCISLYRDKVQPFSEKEIALLENFAAQAVIAMENARLLDEIRQRQEELRVTFENMGDGVAMFDETQHLVAWNRKFQNILDVPDDIIERRDTFSEYVHYLAERGEYDPGSDPEEHARQLIEQAGQSRTYERTRPDGRIIEIRHNPVPGGGFVLIYADITERKRSEEEIRAARDAAETALRELRTAQANLIQAEKMASLGQLTAGIAHEIKNPLNFVNNFAELSVDLLGELKDAIAPAEPALTEKQRAEVEDVSAMLTSNLEKITEHGKRADGIVKAMLEHSRGSSGERRMVDLNTLIDEALNLAYHGARAQDQSFNITLERDFGAGIAPIEINPQDMTRVFLNLFANGFYAVTRRAREGGDAGFVPTLKVITRDAGEAVEIRLWDNGTGIPADIRDKLFQPFFTTKPTGEGTGLGLSITYDIVTQQHGGSIAVDSEVGEYSEFTIRLPRKP